MEKTKKKRRRRRLKKTPRRILMVLVAMASVIGGINFADVLNVAAQENYKNIVIAGNVNEVEPYAYAGKKLESLTVPKNVKSIGFSAFESCDNLKKISFSEGVETINNRAFALCTELGNVVLPDTVKEINTAAFYGCTSMKSIVLPKGITSLGDRIFYRCSGLTTVTIPDTVSSIGRQTFFGCTSLSRVELPQGMKSIAEGAFFGCTGLTEMVIGDQVKSVGTETFLGCDNLTIICHAGSYIETYAKQNGIQVQLTEAEIGKGTGEGMAQAQSEENQTALDASTDDTQEEVIYTPQTGIDTPYTLVVLILIIALLGCFICCPYRWIHLDVHFSHPSQIPDIF